MPFGGRGQPGPRQFDNQQDPNARRIATFITNDNYEDGGGRKGKKPAGNSGGRGDYDSTDLSSFEVATTDNIAMSSGPSGNPQDGSSNNSLGGPETLGMNGNMGNSAPMPQFNPLSFNALDPQSWAGFAGMWQQMFGTIPTNTQLVQWIMMRMQMMGAGPQGGMMQGQQQQPQQQMMGSGMAMGMFEAGGMHQQQQDEGPMQLRNMGQQQYQQGQQTSQGDGGQSQEQEEPRRERPPIPERPAEEGKEELNAANDQVEQEGAGEADMDVNTDDDES